MIYRILRHICFNNTILQDQRKLFDQILCHKGFNYVFHLRWSHICPVQDVTMKRTNGVRRAQQNSYCSQNTMLKCSVFEQFFIDSLDFCPFPFIQRLFISPYKTQKHHCYEVSLERVTKDREILSIRAGIFWLLKYETSNIPDCVNIICNKCKFSN